MVVVRATLVRGRAVLSQAEFEYLMEMARRGEGVETDLRGDVSPSLALVGHQGGIAWGSDDEDLYGREDMKVRYR